MLCLPCHCRPFNIEKQRKKTEHNTKSANRIDFYFPLGFFFSMTLHWIASVGTQQRKREKKINKISKTPERVTYNSYGVEIAAGNRCW